MEKMWLGDLALHAIEEHVIKDVTLFDPPLDSSIRYVVGFDCGIEGSASVTMAFIVPDGYWPPVNTIEQWGIHGLERSECRREREYHWKIAKFFTVLVILGIFWIVYGADKVLG